MKFSNSLRPLFQFCLVCMAVVAFNPGLSHATDNQVTAAPIKFHPDDPETAQGFERFYNMDYRGALVHFEASYQSHPRDPFTINHLLLAVVFQELQRAHVLDPDSYVSNNFLHSKPLMVDSAVQERVKTLTSTALSLTAERLRSNASDVEALYAQGVTKAIQATYAGIVEKSWFAALRYGLGAYKDHKQVLKLSPNFQDAKLVVGMYNYIVASLPWHIKAAAFVIAISGNHDDGIQYLYGAASGGGESSVDAKSFLGVFLTRERRYTEAMSLVRSLHSTYPENFLFAVGEANLLRKSGQLPVAAEAYRKLLSTQHEWIGRDAPIELAAFGLGETLRVQNDYSGAFAAYKMVNTFPHVDGKMAATAEESASAVERLRSARPSP